MKPSARSIVVSLLLASALVGTAAAPSAAAVPASYKGTPFKGVAQAVPGRIEFENVDLGGFGVAYDVDHHENTASGADYRPGEDIPQISRTNTGEFKDNRPDMTLYPSADKPQEYYVGWAHAGDWLKLTIDVKQAGTYKVSSTFASDPDKIRFKMSVNDGALPGVIELEGTKDFHVWKEYKDFASVDLEAGLQVLRFELEIEHLQYDYLEFTLVGGGAAGSAGAGGSGDAGGASAGGAPGASGSPATAGAAALAGSGGSLTASGGSAGAPPVINAGAAPAAGGEESGGCAVRSGRVPRGASAVLLLLGLSALRIRRRKVANIRAS